MLYVSPIKNFRQNVRSELHTRHPVTGDIISTKPAIAAEFGRLGDEQPVFNPLTGEMVMVADIQTGVYDTEVAQAKEGWTDEEREMVERKLDEIAETIPAYVRKLVPVHVAAEPPWQTYTQTPPDRVLALAAELNLVPEALRYERENADREAVVDALEAAMAPEDAGRAKPLEKIDVPKDMKAAVRVGKAPRSTPSGIPVDTPGLELKTPVPPEAPEPTPGRVSV